MPLAHINYTQLKEPPLNLLGESTEKYMFAEESQNFILVKQTGNVRGNVFWKGFEVVLLNGLE